MFETLAKGFRQARNRLAGLTELTEGNIDSALREVRLSLLEADVEIGVVKAFLARVKQKAVGQTLERKLSRTLRGDDRIGRRPFCCPAQPLPGDAGVLARLGHRAARRTRPVADDRRPHAHLPRLVRGLRPRHLAGQGRQGHPGRRVPGQRDRPLAEKTPPDQRRKTRPAQVDTPVSQESL